MNFTIKWKKPGYFFSNVEVANSDRMNGMSEQLIEESEILKSSMLETGVLNCPETLTWDKANSTLIILRDISNPEEFVEQYEPVASQMREVFLQNGWQRVY